MSTTETPAKTFPISSTGMLHSSHGCQVLRPYVSTARWISEDAAAKVALRCLHCRPHPNGTWVEQTDRPTKAQVREAEAVAHHEAHAAKVDAWAASHTDEADAAIRAFSADENADTYHAMLAAMPATYTGSDYMKRARELGVTFQ